MAVRFVWILTALSAVTNSADPNIPRVCGVQGSGTSIIWSNVLSASSHGRNKAVNITEACFQSCQWDPRCRSFSILDNDKSTQSECNTYGRPSPMNPPQSVYYDHTFYDMDCPGLYWKPEIINITQLLTLSETSTTTATKTLLQTDTYFQTLLQTETVTDTATITTTLLPTGPPSTGPRPICGAYAGMAVAKVIYEWSTVLNPTEFSMLGHICLRNPSRPASAKTLAAVLNRRILVCFFFNTAVVENLDPDTSSTQAIFYDMRCFDSISSSPSPSMVRRIQNQIPMLGISTVTVTPSMTLPVPATRASIGLTCALDEYPRICGSPGSPPAPDSIIAEKYFTSAELVGLDLTKKCVEFCQWYSRCRSFSTAENARGGKSVCALYGKFVGSLDIGESGSHTFYDEDCPQFRMSSTVTTTVLRTITMFNNPTFRRITTLTARHSARVPSMRWGR